LTASPPVNPVGQTGNNAIGYESIPREVKLKFKLLEWFENQKQCPLNTNGGFPAWVGWKAVTAAAPAVSTPKQGIAGNRTLFVDGFCPGLSSSGFTCVKTDDEVKARAIAGTVTIRLDNVICTLKDISLYRMADGFTGVRLDFGICKGSSELGAAAPHVPQSASINMGLSEERGAQEANKTKFSEFFMAVCNGGQPADFRTALLPKFTRGSKSRRTFGSGALQPACFAETANTGHVIGKGCFQDFLFFDLADISGAMATIPAADVAGLNALIPKTQSLVSHTQLPPPRKLGDSPCSTHPPATTPATPCGTVPPTTPPETPCGTVPPVPTTTPPPPDVPGVVIADRVCIFFTNCQCFNYCDCTPETPVTFTTPPPVTPPPAKPVCEDFAFQNWLIGVVAFLLATYICIGIHECCVKEMFKTVSHSESKGTGGGNMASMLTTMHSGMPGGGPGMPDNYDVKTKTTTISYNGTMMSLVNFIQTGIVTFCCVHLVYAIWRPLVSSLGTKDDGFWNSIDLDKCPLSLISIAVAIWLMLWLSLSYYYGNATYTYHKHEAKLPLMIGGQMTVGGGGGGFFGGMFGW
jgi:hypothetical protein